MNEVKLAEWSVVRPGDQPSLRGLRLSSPEARRTAELLRQQGVLDISTGEDGLVVESFSFVGRVELDTLRITVLPKLAPDALLQLLRYAYSLRDLRLFDGTTFEPGAQGLQDLLIAQLHAEAGELLHRGPVRRYVRRSEELVWPKGRLDVGRLARRQDPASTSLPCTHHPRSGDFLLNQVVRAGLMLARSLAVAPMLRQRIAQRAAEFSEIANPVTLDADVFRRARWSIDRLSSHYRPILQLIELLHGSISITVEDGEEPIRLKGFLFDMNRFFQALVGRFLRESLFDCRVTDEFSLRQMMAYAPGFNPHNRRAPLPRPDFAVTRGRDQYLLDAKYRDLWRLELPREMLYQLAIYAMSQPPGSTAAILYPTDDLAATEAVVDIKEPMSDIVRAHVALRPVVVPRLLVLLRDSNQMRRQREELAHMLAFGERDGEMVNPLKPILRLGIDPRRTGAR